MSLLTTGVVQGLTEANLHMKSAGVAMRVYKWAEREGDEGVMKRAQGYATDSMKSAGESSKKVQEALIEAQREARKEARAEQEAALEERRQEAAQAKKEKEKKARKSKEDAVEISKEGQDSVKADNSEDIETHQESTVVENLETSTESVINESDQKIYTAQGEIKSTSVDPQLLATV
ncbi:MAG: hypothetical protein FH762_06055 [Firmicutes bacterium]|nr:hypothetical protein [Bacillota bacterium]